MVKKKSKKKHPAIVESAHSLLKLKDPDRDLQPALLGTEYEAENTQNAQRQLLWSQGSFQSLQGYGPSHFLSTSLPQLSQS